MVEKIELLYLKCKVLEHMKQRKILHKNIFDKDNSRKGCT